MVDRSQFPILSKKCYLATHSLGAMPLATRHALQEYADRWADEGILAWEGDWWGALTEFRRSIEAILQAEPDTVVPSLNVTLGFAAIASCFDWKERDKVVLSELEFTTSIPFWRGQGCRLEIVASNVQLDLEPFLAAIDERTQLVVVSHAFFRSGALANLPAIQKRCREQGALLVADGYQSIGAVPFSVKTLEPDFVVGGCHKWLCGGPGGGYLYVREPEKYTPRLHGWFGLAQPFEYMSLEPHPGVQRFLNGTPNVLGCFAAREGLRWIQRLGIGSIRQYSLKLTGLIMQLAENRGLPIRTPRPAEQRNGMVCLDFSRAKEAQKRLQERDVIVDYRPDCGMRVSPHFYNDENDIQRFFSELDKVLG